MNLKWNSSLSRFEAEFHDFQADLAAAQAAGFRCDGPPAWVWSTIKALALKHVREHKPPTLTITADARAQYERLLPIEEKNVEVKAALAEAKKAAKKQQTKAEREGKPVSFNQIDFSKYSDEELLRYIGESCISANNLPPLPPFELPHSKTPIPTVFCLICKVPVYDYEYETGTKNPACFWCQKTVLDNEGGI